ncbi:hypothetical protein WJX79_000521 [Trebouxia sp. C0005]
MVNLAGLHEQLDDLQSHWQNVQRNARQSPGKHQHFADAFRHPAHADPIAISRTAKPMFRTPSAAPHAVAASQQSSFVKPARHHISSDDDTENQWLGSSHTPQSEPSKGKPSQRRRPKPKRPQWQDDVNMRLQQVRSCLRHGRQEEEQPEVPSSSRKSPSGPQTARGRRAVGDGGFAGMRLSQVMPALPPLQPRRHTDTNLHLSQSERRSSDSGGMGPRNRRQEGLDAWQGQGLDEVLRPVQPLGPVQAGRQRMPPAPGSSAALRSTYAGYIQELQQSGASMGNRLALHAGRQQTGPGVTSAADVSHRHPGSSQQLQGRSSVQQPGPNIVSLLRRVTYTEKASQLQQADKIRDKSGGDAQTECSICLENFVMQEQLRRVGCGHLFHTRCIHEWFATGDTRCPMCRFDPVMKRWPG